MIPFTGTVYRVVFTDQDATAPVQSPEGRFHHSRQRAIYTSLTPEGCRIAIKRYLATGDAPRHIMPLHVSLDQLADLRGDPAASVVWQDNRARGEPASTWALSDQARQSGAQGMLYASRSRPDLTHMVLFDITPKVVQLAGTPLPFFI